MDKYEVVKQILINARRPQVGNAAAYAWAPANVALCKYWGKRNVELNLPITSSLSVTLGKKGTFTKISHVAVSDHFVVNGALIPLNSPFAIRLQKFLNLFRPAGVHYLVETDSTVPIAAGFASSASGFAALVLALNNLYNWNLTKRELSILARLGSGSACRSLWSGFVEWQKGVLDDGMDSHSVPLPEIWPELRIGALCFTDAPKAISSTAAMQSTVATSALYHAWPQKVAQDLQDLKNALVTRDFTLLGKTAESNAQAMHAAMAAANPPIVYHQPATLVAMQKVQDLRNQGIAVFFTQDAGANLHLLFLAETEAIMTATFPEIEIIAPFADPKVEQVILVDENDVEVGVTDKLAAHVQGKLHRAFSVFVVRNQGGRSELLIQQRHSAKYHSGGLWSNTCCGHPQPGETVAAAATRRLHEEMGIRAPLKIAGNFRYRNRLNNQLIEHEFDHVLLGTIEDQEIAPNAEEVQDYLWIDLMSLQQDLQQNPTKYTVWLAMVLKILSSMPLALENAIFFGTSEPIKEDG